MNDLRKAAEQALEALTLLEKDIEWQIGSPTLSVLRKSRKALRAALAQPEQEPVAWLIEYENGEREVRFVAGTRGVSQTPLYTAPTPRKPLSHGEFLDIWKRVYEPGHRDYVIAERVARAIEAAHGIGEQT